MWHRHAVHLQIGIEDRQDIEDIRGLRCVVRLFRILEHRAGAIGLHEDVVPALEPDRQVEGLGLCVAIAKGEQTRMTEGGQHTIVEVALDGIGRCDDGVGPCIGRAGASPGPRILYAPTDGDDSRISDDLVVHRDSIDFKIGVGGESDVEQRRRDIVAFGVAGVGLVHLRGGIGDNE